MNADKTFLVRNLIPKSYHFDGYDEIKCPNARDKPFFTDNVIPIGNKHLTIYRIDLNTVKLVFESPCTDGSLTFKPFNLTLEDFVQKLRKAIQDGSDFITFEITPLYNCHSNKYKHCYNQTKDCIQLISKRPKVVYAAVSFDSSQVKEALASYFEISNNNGGKSTMTSSKKNLFGMNFEFGVSKDPNIAATLMGVAVKNRETGNWYTFDTSTGSRKNISNFKMGSFPILLLPTKTLVPGDLVKLNGKYFYVKSVNANNTMTMIDAAAGIIQEMLPEENIILGMTLYTKVVAFDTKTLTDPSSSQGLGGNVLAAVYIMQCAKGNKDEFSLDNINDDSFDGLGAFLPLILASNNAGGGIFAGSDGNFDFSKLITLGAISEGSDDNGMTQMLVLSQLLGGGNSLFGTTTPVVSVASASYDTVVCENCDITYPAGTNFCPKCGSHTKTLQPTCRECGTVLSNDAVFCSNCGAKVKLTTCPECGANLDEGAKFCSKCGHNLNAKSVAASATAEQPTASAVEAK